MVRQYVEIRFREIIPNQIHEFLSHRVHCDVLGLPKPVLGLFHVDLLPGIFLLAVWCSYHALGLVDEEFGVGFDPVEGVCHEFGLTSVVDVVAVYSLHKAIVTRLNHLLVLHSPTFTPEIPPRPVMH